MIELINDVYIIDDSLDPSYALGHRSGEVSFLVRIHGTGERDHAIVHRTVDLVRPRRRIAQERGFNVTVDLVIRARGRLNGNIIDH